MEQIKKKLYPMKFKPTAVKADWGGDRFIGRMDKSYSEQVDSKLVPLTKSDKIGESVEIADLGYNDSEVENGWLSGSTVSEIMETYLEDVVGENVYSRYGRQFPLAIKHLDVEGRMPLLVCPDDEIAAQRYDTLGNTKLWYVMDADPGSCLYMGFKHDISASELYERCQNGSLDEVLNPISAHKGDTFLIPAGLVHSAKGGVVIAEVSEASDLNFSIYNWDKPSSASAVDFTADPAGIGRAASKPHSKRRNLIDSEPDREELSLEAAFDFISLSEYNQELTIKSGKHSGSAHDSNVKSLGAVDDNSSEVADKLVELKEFTVTKINLKDALHINAGTSDAFMLYECLQGSASIQVHRESGDIDRYEFGAGEVILIPADVTDFFMVPQSIDTLLLEVTIEPYAGEDEYINPDADEKLPDDDEADKVASIEEFLRKNPGKMN